MRSKKLSTNGLAFVLLVLTLVVGCRSKSALVDQKAVTKPAAPAATQVAQPAPEKPVEKPQSHEVTYVVRDAFFGYDEASLSLEARKALAESAAWLEQNRDVKIVVEGHCDERGTEQYNLALGEKRAAAARDYLNMLGIDASRLRMVSYGESRPFVPRSDEKAWEQNRRAHLAVQKAP